jgi:hypothetical protein
MQRHQGKTNKTTNIIDTVSSKVQNKFTNEEIETSHHTHGVHQSVRGIPPHARFLPNLARGRVARASATLLDLRRGGVLGAREGRSAARGRFSSVFRFSGFGSATRRGEGTSQSGHAHSVWKISSSFTLRGVSSVVPSENGGMRASINGG